jgi:hypothetical protein
MLSVSNSRPNLLTLHFVKPGVNPTPSKILIFINFSVSWSVIDKNVEGVTDGCL